MRQRLRSAFWLVPVCTLVLVPLSARAETRPAHADITITWDGELNRAHGVRSGTGTMSNPYVISGWTVNNINIKDTDKAIRIVGNTIAGTLTLNWVGPDTVVRGNDIGDLRVNENVARWGDPTAGSIDHNTFTSVGQLRHFDGNFTYNTVGAPQSGVVSSSYPDTRAVNFDGFNGAHFQHNTIYGYVDARLHGHHHSSGYGMPSHMHADGPHDPQMDHTQRYHEVFIDHNAIYTSATYALAYLDTNHAGNDRTANSETNPYLNAPHVHHTRVHIAYNVLNGAGILIDVFNARDERHKGYAYGLVDIVGNRITLNRDLQKPREVLQGIQVLQAHYLTLRITKNTIAGPAAPVEVAQVRTLLAQGAGVQLNGLDHASVTVDADAISNRQFGVQAMQLARTVVWSVTHFSTTDVTTPVSYDSTVANPPRTT